MHAVERNRLDAGVGACDCLGVVRTAADNRQHPSAGAVCHCDKDGDIDALASALLEIATAGDHNGHDWLGDVAEPAV